MSVRIAMYAAIAAFLCAVTALILHLTNTPKVGYIDVPKLIDAYDGMKEARAEFKEKSTVWQANIDTLAKKLQADVKAYEAVRGGLGTAARQEREKALFAQEQELYKYKQALEAKAQEADRKATEGVLAQVNGYIGEYGKDHGYTYILGASGNSSILYADSTDNLTAEIVKGLNARYNNSDKK